MNVGVDYPGLVPQPIAREGRVRQQGMVKLVARRGRRRHGSTACDGQGAATENRGSEE